MTPRIEYGDGMTINGMTFKTISVSAVCNCDEALVFHSLDELIDHLEEYHPESFKTGSGLQCLKQKETITGTQP